MARWASLVEERRPERPILLVDTGDFFFRSADSASETDERYLFRSMQILRYDAIGIGENEMRFGLDELASRVSRYGLPLIATNIVDPANRKPALTPEVVKDFKSVKTPDGSRGTLRAGVFAVTSAAHVYRWGALESRRYSAVDPKLAALESVSRLRERGCQLIIAISNLGRQGSYDLARGVPGIDVVLNGHRPDQEMRIERIGGTAIVDAGDKRRYFTEITVTFNADSLSITAANRCPDAFDRDGDTRLVRMHERYMEETHQLGRTEQRNAVPPER